MQHNHITTYRFHYRIGLPQTPHHYKSKSKNYITTYTFGPGLRIAYQKKRKSSEEIAAYRKQKGLDIYNENDKFIGKYEKLENRWKCYVKINDFIDDDNTPNLLTEMDKLRVRITKYNNMIPPYECIVTENNIFYYVWHCDRKRFPTKESIRNEIKYVAKEITDALNYNI